MLTNDIDTLTNNIVSFDQLDSICDICNNGPVQIQRQKSPPHNLRDERVYGGSDKFKIVTKKNEPLHGKTYKIACAYSEDSDQPGHLPSLISLHCVLSG